MTVVVSELAALERQRHADAVERASRASKTADAAAYQAREAFYNTLRDAHGPPADGKLTYDEIADVSEWTRGWVRMAIGNHKKRKANTT